MNSLKLVSLATLILSFLSVGCGATTGEGGASRGGGARASSESARPELLVYEVPFGDLEDPQTGGDSWDHAEWTAVARRVAVATFSVAGSESTLASNEPYGAAQAALSEGVCTAAVAGVAPAVPPCIVGGGIEFLIWGVALATGAAVVATSDGDAFPDIHYVGMKDYELPTDFVAAPGSDQAIRLYNNGYDETYKDDYSEDHVHYPYGELVYSSNWQDCGERDALCCTPEAAESKEDMGGGGNIAEDGNPMPCRGNLVDKVEGDECRCRGDDSVWEDPPRPLSRF